MTNEISLDESMMLCLKYLECAAQAATLRPEQIFKEFGEHLGVAWELRQELLSGKALLTWRQLSPDLRRPIQRLIADVESMPGSAYAGFGLNDLTDPHWELVRRAANEVVTK